jgi:hypothetical protein
MFIKTAFTKKGYLTFETASFLLFTAHNNPVFNQKNTFFKSHILVNLLSPKIKI